MIQKKYSEEQERMARFAKAMGHPARMAILQFLARQESCFFGDIHEELPIAKATVSQHLKELKDAGLIQGEIEAPKVKYCINRENWEIARRMSGATIKLKIRSAIIIKKARIIICDCFLSLLRP